MKRKAETNVHQNNKKNSKRGLFDRNGGLFGRQGGLFERSLALHATRGTKTTQYRRSSIRPMLSFRSLTLQTDINGRCHRAIPESRLSGAQPRQLPRSQSFVLPSWLRVGCE